MERDYLSEAFKALDELNEEVFDISVNDGYEKAQEFIDEPVDDRDEEIIIDPLAKTEDDLEKDYIGKVVLQCEICQSMIYKDPSEVVIDEELGLANVDEACPLCQSEDGFKVIGQIDAYCGDEECEHTKDEEHDDNDEESEESSEEVEIEEDEREELDEAISSRRGGTNYDKVMRTLKSLGEGKNTLDDIDADADDKKERAKKKFAKAKDDADADRDYKLKKHNLKEADKSAAISIEDAQKWVDFDMKRYGKISNRTNRLVKKAGFQILKDDHGDYEVAAGKFESCNENWQDYHKRFEIVTYNSDMGDDEKLDFDTFREAKEKAKDYFSDYEAVAIYDFKDKKWYHLKGEHSFEECLKEDFERVDIETDRERLSMLADENGKVTVTTEPKTEEVFEDEVEETEEIIEPVSDETKAKFKSSEEAEEIDYDFDEFEESDFDELGEGYLKHVYENVKSFKTTKGAINGNKLKLEGLITFKSGKQAKTNFVFESYRATKTGKLKFIGENKQFAKGNKSFTLSGRADGKKLVCESLTYNYVGKSADGKSKRLYGTVRK